MKLRSPHLAALRALADPTVRPRDVRRALGVETATRRWLIGGVLPLWLGAGLADWHRHRRTRIETTAGTRESMIHSLMMTEAGVPVALGLFCEVNPGVLATCAGALAVHGVTAYWDVSYAEERRRVTPLEQHIHSLLEVVPLMATGFLTVLYWDQARALAGQNGRPDFRLRLKRRDPLSRRTRIALLAAMGVFGVLPYGEEMVRCLRARPTFKPQPTTEPAPTTTLSIPADPEHATAE
ncbi:MAG TPA: diguanylate cyclase [Spirillospora sp.]|nr:diguanylate cyclase [Spirillospora sp.]